jgi:hypothetical protein
MIPLMDLPVFTPDNHVLLFRPGEPMAPGGGGAEKTTGARGSFIEPAGTPSLQTGASKFALIFGRPVKSLPG